MRKFLITNPKRFSGAAEIYYNEQGALCKIDLMQANMVDEVAHHFKMAIPVTLSKLLSGTCFSADTVLVEAGYEVSFEMFWDAYKKKIHPGRCRQVWDRLTKTERVQAYHHIAAYNKYLQKETWRSKADPITYLRAKYWENEYK